MFLVAQRLPADQLDDALRRRRQQVEQHDRFVEVIEVIAREPGLGIDIGGRHPRRIERGRAVVARAAERELSGYGLARV